MDQRFKDLEHPLFHTEAENDRYMYLQMAEMIGKVKGTCSRRNVGACLTAGGRLREIGWNGMERASGVPSCLAGACPRGLMTEIEQPHGFGYSNCVYLHAEFNAAENFRHAQRARNVEGWATPFGVMIYTSSIPCEDCNKYAAWAGIELVWNGMED